MSAPLRIGIAGLGTVGANVARLLVEQTEILSARAGRKLVLAGISARARGKDRGFNLSAAEWFADPVALARSSAIDVFVELMGGEGDPSKAAVEAALGAGKPVVTANKALLAHHGAKLAAIAEAKGLALDFEAAVAGGIPIILSCRTLP